MIEKWTCCSGLYLHGRSAMLSLHPLFSSRILANSHTVESNVPPPTIVMLYLLAIFFYLIQGGANAVPLPALDQDTLPPCGNCRGYRTRWDIVQSCLVTMLMCIWLSLHPNVPDSETTTVKLILLRLRLMAMALIAPEWVALWA